MERQSEVGHEGHELRRLPRIICSHIAAMDVRGRPSALARYIAIPVAIRSVSVGGLGVTVLDEALTTLERGALVALRIGEGRRLSMPGYVAWSRGTDHESSVLELGIQLTLLGVPPWTRMRYSAWVDEVVSASRVTASC